MISISLIKNIKWEETSEEDEEISEEEEEEEEAEEEAEEDSNSLNNRVDSLNWLNSTINVCSRS